MVLSATVFDQVEMAKQRLDAGPLSPKTVRAVESMHAKSTRERVLHGAASYLANRVACPPQAAPLRFSEVSEADDWGAVRALRKRCYPKQLPYLTDLLDDEGGDRYDRHSFVYAAFIGDRAVATIRATLYPYETMAHLDETRLSAFLGSDWRTEYVEWGRLLVEASCAGMRIMPALITYAGLRLMAANYRSYFGYTTKRVRKALARYPIASDHVEFSIPSRGKHTYLLLKGRFSGAALKQLPHWFRSRPPPTAPVSRFATSFGTGCSSAHR